MRMTGQSNQTEPRGGIARRAASFGGVLLIAGVVLAGRGGRAADAGPGLNSTGHEHGTNLAIYLEWRTNHLRLHYPVPASKTCVLQFLPMVGATSSGTNLPGATWSNLPGFQAQRLPASFNWEMNDYSVTNRQPTNLGRIYRLKVT